MVARLGTDDDRIGRAHEVGRYLIDQGYFRNCINCLHWSEPSDAKPNAPNGCLEFKAMPPPRVIAYGCSKHSDTIPF